ncbi:cation diffusion facilitator family transporter [Desulfosporosinus sp.]|uniref:cation diffusion facilitator family transporter n=1 Tax=Desulfosporosinus sp. TaxID=157907 RepID=UPI0025BA1754|nr:cation diffusion facilitator family transporter [Desulfosporosinus sp.]MBC2725097.1 cation transporter [Desulfosporosinus sp.]
MGHGHQGHDHGISREESKKGLTTALIITFCIMILEFIGGLITNSLALLSDAGHMLSDSSSLVLSLVAFWFAAKPPSPNKTYGFYRFEILAAFFNGITLFLMAGWIVYEAYERIVEPPTVSSEAMILIAGIGLIANLLSAYFLMQHGNVKGNVNVKSAYLHVIGDALGSFGAIIAGILMMIFDWYVADPIISVVVALLILKSAWDVLKTSIHILMEGTPITIDQKEVRKTLLSIEGIEDIHDLHIWTITSGLDSLTCHVLIDDNQTDQDILQQVIDLIRDKYEIVHTTVQIEKRDLQHKVLKI